MSKPKRVAIVAAGINKWGARPTASFRDLIAEAAKACFGSNPRINNKDIEGLVTSGVYPQRSGPQCHPSPVACEVLGVKPRLFQNTDCQCQSGAVNMRIIWSAIVAGLIDVGMAVGWERILIPNHGERYINAALATDHDWEQGFGMTPPALFALPALSHMEKYGTTEEQYAKIAVKNHTHSTKNPNAHFQKGLTLEQAMGARTVATPLKLFDCCVNTDGAGAVILCSEEKAYEYSDNPVWILGWGQGFTNWTIANNPKDLTDWEGVRLSGELAYKMAGITAKDVEIAELHDCFTASELIEYEELGFCPKGEGGAWVDAGGNDYGGDVVTQSRGGLLACGHPFGATSIAQAHEIYLQLRGEAGERQVSPRPNIGLGQTMSGVGTQSMVTIFGSDDTQH